MKTWNYATAGTTRCGRMVCSCCDRKIESGSEFRYRETDAGFITQHRACTTSDHNWTRLDAEAKQHSEETKRRLSAFTEFRDQWGTDALDDEIAELRYTIDSM